MSNSSIWLIDRTLFDATTQGQSEPGSSANEGLLRISQRYGINEASPSDWFVSYPEHSLGEFYPSAEIHLVYFTALADWAQSLWAFNIHGYAKERGYVLLNFWHHYIQDHILLALQQYLPFEILFSCFIITKFYCQVRKICSWKAPRDVIINVLDCEL